jgi:hypothetical protein
MGMAVRDWKVTGHEPLIDSLKLPDPDDRHVLAAAIRAGAQVNMTSSPRDFPTTDVQPWDIQVKSPDEFIRDQISLHRSIMYAG